MIIIEFSELLKETTSSANVPGYLTAKAWCKDKKQYRNMVKRALQFYYKGFTLAPKDNVNFKPIWNNTSCGSNDDLLKENLTANDYVLLQKFIRQQIALLLYDLFKKRSIWI